MAKYHEGVADGVRMMWNNEFENGEKFFAKIKENSPRGALEYAHMKMLENGIVGNKATYRDHIRRYSFAETLSMVLRYGGQEYVPDLKERLALEEEEEAENESAQKAHEKKIEAAEKKMLKAAQKYAKDKKVHVSREWDVECESIQAEALFIKGFFQFFCDAWFRSGLNIRKSYKIFQELLKKIDGVPQELQDAVYWGAGMYATLLALLPANINKILSAVGFQADSKLGESYLTGVFERRGIKAPWAGVVQTLYYALHPSGLNDYRIALEKGKPILDAANEMYPDNSYFHLLVVLSIRKDGENKVALESIRKAMNNYPAPDYMPHLFYFLEVDTLYVNFLFDEVMSRGQEVFSMFDERGESFDMAGVMCLEIAAAALNLDKDDEEVVSWMKKGIKLGNHKNKQDGPAIKWMQRLLQEPAMRPYLGVSIFYFQWRNMHHMKLEVFPQIQDMLDKAKKQSEKIETTPEATAFHELLQAVIDHREGNNQEAIARIGKIFALQAQVDRESPVFHYAYYELAELHYHEGNVKEAENLLKIGQKLKGGDGNETLSSRYRLALRQIAAQK